MYKFDVVVVGSGFGGSVTALRLAEAGHSVCVLERGRLYPPNSFARSPYTFARNFWDPQEGHYGLFDVWSFGHMDAIVSAGVGGGSLIYSNVLIRKDKNWFKTQVDDIVLDWPVTRRDLEPHYAVAEQMLGGQVFPMKMAPYNAVPRAVEFKEAAQALGFSATRHDKVDPTRKQWYLPLLAVTFRNKGHAPVPGEAIVEEVRNLHDRDRQTCRLCSECNIGCNYGSKNTLDYNYLTLAKNHGAVIRPLADVISFAHAPGGKEGFDVTYVQYEEDPRPGGESIPGKTFSIHGKHLVLSAGTLGSTYLMMMAKREGWLPDYLGRPPGQRFSSNGDLLSVAVEAHRTSPDGKKREPRVIESSYGPAIISTVRSPDAWDGAADGTRGFYVQDAGYPAFVDWLIQAANVPSNLGHLAIFVLRRLFTRLLGLGADISEDLAKLLSNTKLSADSLPLGGMGRDTPDAAFTLDKRDRLTLPWSDRKTKPLYRQIVKTSKDIADKLEADYMEDPLARTGRLITVHPLGGCAMSTDPKDGVVDPWGRVHGVKGLHIADGSVMPGPVGANPSLTIAALAERFAEQMVKDMIP